MLQGYTQQNKIISINRKCIVQCKLIVGDVQESLKNKVAKAFNTGIKNLDEEKGSSSEEKSSSSEEEDNSSSEENSSSSEEEDGSSSEEEENNSSTEEDLSDDSSKFDYPELSKLPTFEFFFDQEDLGIDELGESDSSESNSPVDGFNMIPIEVDVSEPRSLVDSDNKGEINDEYSTFASEKNPALDFSIEEEELGIEDVEYVKKNTYFPNFQGPKTGEELQPIIDVEENENELDLSRRDVQNIGQNSFQNEVQRNEDCSNSNLELDYVVCLIKETYESVTSQFSK